MHHSLTIRAVEIEGEPWFLAADVRKAIGLQQGGTNFHALSDHEIMPLPSGLITGKGMGNAKLLSESGLYKLVMRSDKPEAKKFQQWVTETVLPAIRKDGGHPR